MSTTTPTRPVAGDIHIPIAAAEKELGLIHDTALSSSDSDAELVKDWDEKEEASVRRKIDLILLPILGLAFFALQVDRGNISAALTSTITEDLRITTNQINIGSQLLSAGIVITEIPSNILLQRIGPQVWLSGQLFAWGLVATFQAFVKTYPAYLATRLLLGLLEGGFIPGALYYLSTWYKKDETSFRTTLFFFGQMFAGATASLISAGLLQLDGRGGLEGWRWIFLVEGIITLLAGVIFTLLVPSKAGDGKPFLSGGRWSYFTPRESHIIVNRVLLDDPRKANGHVKITGSDIWKTVRQPRILQHFFITLVAMSGFSGLTQYTPSLIKSFGFGAVRANALASVPIYASMLWTLILSYFADRTGHRGPFVLLSITWNVISYTCLRVTPFTSDRWHRYTVLTIANVAYCSMHVLNIGWLSVYCTTPQERSISMALIVMAANCAGISGSQIFRTSDAPRYRNALTAICALAAASWVQTVVLGLQYMFRRKKARKSEC
ncbi:putative MFS transporter [Aspergillus clavatus NRRL 1]|uniref:MFS transporter, putative n=1 Tax=Aspergillus clavatus (strain ATCC 1007 / CBS 513.65 / DSM 816 / NCTC 3887 / NRRL 1 / QM 1276 / 107) TaxID=344612 RepID=A1C8G6_ASPCL|nr:MFS transporter, putative [Aspergillus clavatus NRRL 1]EAW13603.1 MFS transporter, putative [Aspergillus clavatus NRRL 1]